MSLLSKADETWCVVYFLLEESKVQAGAKIQEAAKKPEVTDKPKTLEKRIPPPEEAKPGTQTN